MGSLRRVAHLSDFTVSLGDFPGCNKRCRFFANTCSGFTFVAAKHVGRFRVIASSPFTDSRGSVGPMLNVGSNLTKGGSDVHNEVRKRLSSRTRPGVVISWVPSHSGRREGSDIMRSRSLSHTTLLLYRSHDCSPIMLLSVQISSYTNSRLIGERSTLLFSFVEMLPRARV